MALMKNLKDLPSGSPDAGRPPVKHPTLAPLLAQAWMEAEVDEGDRPMASESARIRHSWAGMCSRNIGYRVSGLEITDEFTLSDYWRMGLGSHVHDLFQQILVKLYPDAQVEAVLAADRTAGHADAVVTVGDKRVLVELKTINGFGFKRAIGAQGSAEGPRTSAVLQGALNALLADVDEVWIVYISLECISVNEAKKKGLDDIARFCAEWHFTQDEWMPLAQEEMARLNEIIDLADVGALPPRFIPGGDMPATAEIVDPGKGRWEHRQDGLIIDTGRTWQCDYCPFQVQCIADNDAGI